MQEQTPLPQSTQDTYDELASGASSQEELDALKEMHEQDTQERARDIAGIAERKLPDIDSNGVVMTEEESNNQIERRQNGETDEYGQGGARA